MSVLVVAQQEIPALLPMPECIDLMAGTLAQLARGEALLPLRTVLSHPRGTGAFAVMPAYTASPPAFGAKAITVFPGNEGTALDSHQGAVLLFDAQRGELVAIMDASAITAIRTAAVSAVATRTLARQDSATLALLGSGVQATTHLEAMLCVRPIRSVRVWSRTPAHAQAFARRERARHGVDVQATPSAADAVRGADIVCTVTAAREPVLLGEWLEPGMHLNAVGSSQPWARELDAAAVARARLYVDRRESTLHESGDFLAALAEGAVDQGHIVAELGEVLLGRASGRGAPGEITLFKSLGLAVEDVACASFICRRARERGVGTTIDLGGKRA